MLTERKLTERELDSRKVVLKGLLQNKQNLVKKYGKDAEKVMYGIATKKAKSKVEEMNKEKIKELIVKALTHERVANSVDDVIDPADYIEIGQGYLKGFKRPHSLKDADLETLGRKIVKVLAKGDIEKAKAKFIDEDNDPSGANLEGDPDEKVMGENRREKNPVGMGQLYVQPSVQKEIKRQLDAYDAGDIDVNDLIRGIEDIIFGYVKAPTNEDLDVGHQDDEPGMLKRELARAGQMVQMLYRAVDKYDGQGEVDFPQWWQKKIIQANVMLDSAFDYLDGEEMVAKIDAIRDMREDVSDANMAKGIEVIKKTLSKEGGAAGLEPLVKELVKLGFKKGEVVDLLSKMTSVKKHRDGDYILLPLEEKELSKKDVKDLKKISKQLDKSVKAHDTQAKRISKIVKEKLTKRNDVGDFVDDFKKSKAKQFRGKSAKKKKEMAVAAYLAKQNEK